MQGGLFNFCNKHISRWRFKNVPVTRAWRRFFEVVVVTLLATLLTYALSYVYASCEPRPPPDSKAPYIDDLVSFYCPDRCVGCNLCCDPDLCAHPPTTLPLCVYSPIRCKSFGRFTAPPVLLQRVQRTCQPLHGTVRGKHACACFAAHHTLSILAVERDKTTVSFHVNVFDWTPRCVLLCVFWPKLCDIRYA